MRIRIHSNSRVDVLNLKRKAYKKGKDVKPTRRINQLNGKRKLVAFKRKTTTGRVATSPEWLSGRGTLYPAPTSSMCSKKSPQVEVTHEDSLLNLNGHINHPRCLSTLSKDADTKCDREKCMNNEDDKNISKLSSSESSDSENCDSETSSTSDSSGCSNSFSDNDDSDTDSNSDSPMIPIANVKKSSPKLISCPVDPPTANHSCHNNKENSKPPLPLNFHASVSNCTGGEIHLHYNSHSVFNSICESIKPGTGSKNLSFLMQHLADRIRSERGREVSKNTSKASSPIVVSQSRKNHMIRTHKELLHQIPHYVNHRFEHYKRNNSNKSVPTRNSLSFTYHTQNSNVEYFPSFDDIADFEDIPKTLEDFDMSAFHEFRDCEERFAVEWEFVEELVKESLKDSNNCS